MTDGTLNRGVIPLDQQDPLRWLNSVLWPSLDGGFRRCALADQGSPQWWATPSAARPQTLLPATPRRTARHSTRRYHDGKGWSARGRVAAAELLVAAPIRIGWGPFAERITVDGADRGVLGGLRAALGVDELGVAVTLAAAKSNRKPVLGLFDGRGRRIGFAKVAADPYSESLLDNEQRWLGRRACAPLAVPALVWAGTIEGRRVVIQQAVVPPRLLRRSIVAAPPAPLFAAVAALGDRRRGRLGDSEWWDRVQSVLEVATPVERRAVERSCDPSTRLELGAWHGDLAAWNLYTRHRRIDAIDWEFAAVDVPLGFDVCHFHLQAGNETMGLAAAPALARARTRISPTLTDMGVAPSMHETLWRCYLVELVRRQLALRARGLATEEITHGPAALRALTSAVEVDLEGAPA